MKKITISTTIVFLLLFSQSYSYAKMYKWVDKDGITQFSAFPPDNINDDFQTLSINSKGSSNPKDHINGVWLASKDNYNYKLSIFEKGVRFERRQYGSNKYPQVVFTGSWILNGKKLEFNYTSHLNKKIQGKKDLFFITKISENKLVLINNKTNVKIRYHREGSKSIENLSPTMKKLLGKWTGASVKHHITFNDNGSFYIDGLFNNGFSRMYDGDWEYNDPQLLFHFKADFAIPSGSMSKSGKTETYFVKTLTDVSLIIKSKKSGAIKSFRRKKKEKWKNRRTP